MLLKTFATVLAAVLTGTVALGTQASPFDPDAILTMAHQGRAADAWNAWEASPRTPDHLRLGVTLAAATRQVGRGIDLYETLTKETGQPDRQALTALALETAEEMSATNDMEVRVNACAAALLLDKTYASCRRLLSEQAQSREVDDQALAVYALANAGVRPAPGVMRSLAGMMSRSMRLQLARRMTRLSGAERLALLQPLLNDPDVATQYEAVLTTIDVPGPEVADALARLEGGPLPPPVKTAVMLSRARHGDRSRLAAIIDALPSLSAFEKVTAGAVLARANDKRGIDVLNEMLKSRVDFERLQAARALAELNPKAARPVLLESVRGGSVAIRQSAILAAGALELGTNPEVYRRLVDSSPVNRAAAVEAIGATFWIQDNRPRSYRVQ